MIYLPMTLSYLDVCDLVCSVFCLIIVLFIFVAIAFVINQIKNSTEGTGRHRVETRCPRCGGPIGWLDHECEWCGYDMKSQGKGGVVKDIRTGTYKFFTERSEERRYCKDCGAKLIYRAEYYSWYCPECHSYQ